MSDQMKALVFRGTCNIALEDVPIPTIQDPTDAIVRISLCAVGLSEQSKITPGGGGRGKLR
jgi:threonine dehydrogenase-like Zn-dependent dehydrogenase